MASFVGPESYWWLRPSEPDNPLPAMALGARIRQDAVNTLLQQEQNKIAQERNMLLTQEQVYKQRLQNLQIEGSAELAKIASGVKDWSSPEVRTSLYNFANKYPFMASTEVFKGVLSANDDAMARKEQMARDLQTATLSDLQSADKLEQEAANLEATNPEQAKRNLQNAAILRSKHVSPTETIKIGVDAEGRPTYEVTKGPLGQTGTATGSAATDSQKRLLSIETSMQLLSELRDNLREEDLGARGKIGEIVDRFGPQIGISIPDKERTQNRTALKTTIQSMVRLISSDQRFSNEDRKRAEAVAPSEGWDENLQHARDTIDTLQDIFRKQGIVHSKAIGANKPEYTLTLDEVARMVFEGKITEAEGSALLRKWNIRK
jgi:hypothetical protein